MAFPTFILFGSQRSSCHQTNSMTHFAYSLFPSSSTLSFTSALLVLVCNSSSIFRLRSVFLRRAFPFPQSVGSRYCTCFVIIRRVILYDLFRQWLVCTTSLRQLLILLRIRHFFASQHSRLLNPSAINCFASYFAEVVYWLILPFL